MSTKQAFVKLRLTTTLDVAELANVKLWQKGVGIFKGDVQVQSVDLEGLEAAEPKAVMSLKKRATKKVTKKKATKKKT